MPDAPAHPRLQPGEEDFRYDRATVLGSRQHMDARKVVDRLLRYERVLGKKMEWTPLEFEGRRILEIGCGPLFGWGPIAMYLGAAEYLCIEPKFDADVCGLPEVRTRFFLPLHQQLEAIFARVVPFAAFVDRLARIQVQPVAFGASIVAADWADLVISKEVLQHIADLDDTVARIAMISHSKGRQFHNVNFTDHMSPPDDPFRQIYTLNPAEYFARDSLLNLRRPSEILRRFHEAGLPVRLVPYYSAATLPEGLAEYWRRFDPADLAIEIAFLVT